MLIMYVLGALVIIVKGIGNVYGILSLFNEFGDSHRVLSNIILAAGSILDLIFSVYACMGFLFVLSGSDYGQKKTIMEILLDFAGYRLVMISGVHLVICLFAIYNALRPATYITSTGFYLPSWAFGLELWTFLELSYVTAKEIALKNRFISPSHKPNLSSIDSKKDGYSHKSILTSNSRDSLSARFNSHE